MHDSVLPRVKSKASLTDPIRQHGCVSRALRQADLAGESPDDTGHDAVEWRHVSTLRPPAVR